MRSRQNLLIANSPLVSQLRFLNFSVPKTSEVDLKNQLCEKQPKIRNKSFIAIVSAIVIIIIDKITCFLMT